MLRANLAKQLETGWGAVCSCWEEDRFEIYHRVQDWMAWNHRVWACLPRNQMPPNSLRPNPCPASLTEGLVSKETLVEVSPYLSHWVHNTIPHGSSRFSVLLLPSHITTSDLWPHQSTADFLRISNEQTSGNLWYHSVPQLCNPRMQPQAHGFPDIFFGLWGEAVETNQIWKCSWNLRVKQWNCRRQNRTAELLPVFDLDS